MKIFTLLFLVFRANVSATVVGDKIWAVGGFSGKVFLNTTEYLDAKRDEWTTYILAEPSTPEEVPTVEFEITSGLEPETEKNSTTPPTEEKKSPVSVPNGVRFTIEGLKNGEPIFLSPRGSTSSEDENKTPEDVSRNCGD